MSFRFNNLFRCFFNIVSLLPNDWLPTFGKHYYSIQENTFIYVSNSSVQSVESSSRGYMYVYLRFKGASTSQVIDARSEIMMDDNEDQMIFGDLVGLKLPDICFTGEEKPRKNLTQETCPDRGSNPGPLRYKRACYPLLHSCGHFQRRKTSYTYRLF